MGCRSWEMLQEDEKGLVLGMAGRMRGLESQLAAEHAKTEGVMHAADEDEHGIEHQLEKEAREVDDAQKLSDAALQNGEKQVNSEMAAMTDESLELLEGTLDAMESSEPDF